MTDQPTAAPQVYYATRRALSYSPSLWPDFGGERCVIPWPTGPKPGRLIFMCAVRWPRLKSSRLSTPSRIPLRPPAVSHTADYLDCDLRGIVVSFSRALRSAALLERKAPVVGEMAPK